MISLVLLNLAVFGTLHPMNTPIRVLISTLLLSTLVACGFKPDPVDQSLAESTDIVLYLESPAPIDPSAASDRKDGWGLVLNQSRTDGIVYGTSTLGPEPLSVNDDKVFIPASITKVLTSALALEALGSDFRFVTRVEWQKPAPESNGVIPGLRITGTGDPTLGMKDFDSSSEARLFEIARALKDKGVRGVQGPIDFRSADTRYDVPVHAPGVEESDFLECYGALAQAFNFRHNCGSFVLKGMNKGEWREMGLRFPMTFEVKKGDRNRLKATPILDPVGLLTGFHIAGTLSSPASWRMPIYDVKSWLRSALITVLQETGISVDTETLALESGETDRLSIWSPPLEDIMETMNKRSDNLLADALFRAAAVRWHQKDLPLREAGEAALREAIRRWSLEEGQPSYAREIQLLDGAGLSRWNSATSRAFLLQLKHISRRADFGVIWNSLPIAGRDGTLKGRMSGTRADGVLRAKTGTVRGFYQLAGYVPRFAADRSVEEYVPFVVLTETTEANRHRARAFQDKIGAKLVELINPSTSRR